MAIVFLGTSEFAAAVLQTLAESTDQRPGLVLTRPDRPSGRGRRVTPPPVAERARELGIELSQPDSVNSPEVRQLIARAGATAAGANAERHTVVVCAFGALIKEPLLSEHEIVNVHPSLLPRWRGAAPIERAIIAGDERTGVSIMRLTAGLDSGPVCAQEALPIEPLDTFGSLSARLAPLAGALLLDALRTAPAYVEQSEQGVTYAEKLDPSDRVLDPSRPASELERRVRALHPHIGARVQLPDGTMLGVRRAAVLVATGRRGNGVSVREGRLVLACEPGELELLRVQPPGRRAMDGADYVRGLPSGRL